MINKNRDGEGDNMNKALYKMGYSLGGLLLPVLYSRCHYYWTGKVNNTNLDEIDFLYTFALPYLAPISTGLLEAVCLIALVYFAVKVWESKRGVLFTALIPTIMFAAWLLISNMHDISFLPQFIKGYISSMILVRTNLCFDYIFLVLFYFVFYRRKRELKV